MFDSEGAWFLIVIFVLWVLESIAKARQRSRFPEEAGGEDGTLSPPTTLEAPPEARTSAERKPRNLWEEIAEIARQQQQQQQQQLPPSEAPRRGAPPPRRRPERTKTPVLHERTPSTRWESAAEEEGTRRPQPVEAAAADERRSERWTAGRLQEGESAEGLATYDSEEARPRTVDATTRPRREPPPPDETRRAARAAQAPAAAHPMRMRKAPRAPMAAAAAAGTSGGPSEGLGIDAHSLRGASRAELRRVLILREVLGPPVALREGTLPEE